MKKLLGVLLTAVLLSNFGVANAAKKAGPVTVWEDAANDAGPQESPTPGFTEAGFDLLSGTITRNKANLEFTVKHAAMPPIGTLPEAFRFLWDFNVNGVEYRFTVKRADIGKPDALAQNGQERVGRVDVNGHFRLEGECKTVPTGALNAINCTPLAYLEGTWDPAAQSFTVILPMKLVKAKTGSIISGGAGEGSQICQICWGTHLAERTLNAALIDSTAMSTSYKIPK
ncbi:MAG: hypothetical protein M3217_00710 [Actinomycetota bacterium]|nr:hypothetical protein [Actinomycetota bacterium]